MAQKELTTEYAADIKGVKAVENEMTVTKALSVPERTIMEKIDDASITAQIKSSLLVHRSTSEMKTNVRTIDGVVTVSGTAEDEPRRVLWAK